VAILIVFSALFLYLGFHTAVHANPADLYINLAAGGIFSIFALLFIELFRDRQRSFSGKEGRFAATSDANRMSRMLVEWAAGNFGESVLTYKIDPNNEDISRNQNAIVMSQKMMALSMINALREFSPGKWQILRDNLIGLKGQVNEFAEYYKEMTPLDVYGKYLEVRRLHMGMVTSFAPNPFSDLLTKPEDEWAHNKYGVVYMRQLRENQLTQMAEMYEKYISSLVSFHLAVVCWFDLEDGRK